MNFHENLNAGLFGIGLDTYWPQFPGLKERLERYQHEISQNILSFGGVSLIDAGLVDNPERARGVGSLFRQQQIFVLFRWQVAQDYCIPYCRFLPEK